VPSGSDLLDPRLVRAAMIALPAASRSHPRRFAEAGDVAWAPSKPFRAAQARQEDVRFRAATLTTAVSDDDDAAPESAWFCSAWRASPD
jgi:hypothetical protein